MLSSFQVALLLTKHSCRLCLVGMQSLHTCCSRKRQVLVQSSYGSVGTGCEVFEVSVEQYLKEVVPDELLVSPLEEQLDGLL